MPHTPRASLRPRSPPPLPTPGHSRRVDARHVAPARPDTHPREFPLPRAAHDETQTRGLPPTADPHPLLAAPPTPRDSCRRNAHRRRRRRELPGLAASTDEADGEDARRQRRATEHDSTASAPVPNPARCPPAEAPSPPGSHVAEAAEAKAAALRDAQDAGLIAASHHVDPDWRPPIGTAARQHDYPSSHGSSWTEPSTSSPPTLDDPPTPTYTHARPRTTNSAKAAREVAKQLSTTTDRPRELSSANSPARSAASALTARAVV